MRCGSVVEGLRSRGHDVHVLTSSFRPGEAECEAANVTRALHLVLGPPYPPEDLGGMLRCEMDDRQILARVLAETRPDVVDVWGMEFASQSLVASLIETGHPVHLTVEDKWLLDGYTRDPLCAVAALAGDLGVRMSRSIKRLCCLGLSRPPLEGARVCFVSRALSDWYRGAGFSHPHCRVQIAGIDLSALRGLAPAAEPPPFVIVSVGQLTSSRGQVDLITAAGRVAAEEGCRWPVVVRVVGQGSAAYVSRLRELGGQHASEGFRVELTGLLPPERVAEFYAGAHLLVHTSHLPEGLPRVLMEAMGAGVPVISTNTGGQRDILDKGRWGPLLDPGDLAALAEAIREAMMDRPAWQARARRGRRHALEHFDIDSYVEKHADHLAEAAEAGKCGTPAACDDGLPGRRDVSGFVTALGAAAEGRAASMVGAKEPEQAWHLGVVLVRAGRLGAAETVFSGLHDLGPADPTSFRRSTFHLAQIAMVRGQWQRAGDLLRACLSVAPDHAKAQFDLDWAEKQRLPDHLSGLA